MQIERQDRMLTIVVNRPPMNPIHYALHHELARLWHQAPLDHAPKRFNQKILAVKPMIFGLLDSNKTGERKRQEGRASSAHGVLR